MSNVICKRCNGLGYIRTKQDFKLCETCSGTGEA